MRSRPRPGQTEPHHIKLNQNHTKCRPKKASIPLISDAAMREGHPPKHNARGLTRLKHLFHTSSAIYQANDATSTTAPTARQPRDEQKRKAGRAVAGCARNQTRASATAVRDVTGALRYPRRQEKCCRALVYDAHVVSAGVKRYTAGLP